MVFAFLWFVVGGCLSFGGCRSLFCVLIDVCFVLFVGMCLLLCVVVCCCSLCGVRYSLIVGWCVLLLFVCGMITFVNPFFWF